MTRRSYTAAEKAEALELYRTDGPTIVEERLGIPKGTIAAWAARTGTQTVCIETTAARVVAKRLKWEERRADLADDIGNLARIALERATRLAEEGNTREAKDLATTMAIAVDKAQLLTGAATSRSEHITSDIDAAVVELEKELALRGPTRTPA
jgi:transposase-like protein